MALEVTNMKNSKKRSRSKSPSPMSDQHSPRKKARTAARELDNSIPERELPEPRKAVTNVCALTNLIGEDVLPVRLISKNTPTDLIDDLEFAWGMDSGSLDLDNSNNFVWLSPKARETFEAGHWALMPFDMKVVNRLYGFTMGDKDYDFKSVMDIYQSLAMDTFSFRIVPLRDFKSALTRYKDSDGRHPVIHQFSKFPKVTLRVHPHLAVVDLIAKYRSHSDDEKKVLREWLMKNLSGASLTLCMLDDVYLRWAPTKEFDDEYAHLPPLDRELNHIICPDDSQTLLSIESGSKDDSAPADFSESAEVLRTRINNWSETVAKALQDSGAEPPVAVSYPIPPSPPSSPPAPSSLTELSSALPNYPEDAA